MPVGNQQVVVMTYVALHYPETPSKNRICESLNLSNQTRAEVMQGLQKKGWIINQNPEGKSEMALTKEGWDALLQISYSPVTVGKWDDDGRPVDIKVRKSTKVDHRRSRLHNRKILLFDDINKLLDQRKSAA